MSYRCNKLVGRPEGCPCSACKSERLKKELLPNEPIYGWSPYAGFQDRK